MTAEEREHYQTLGNLIRSCRPLPAMRPEQAQEALDDLLPWGTRSIYFRDPDGNLVDFYSPVPAS